MRANYGRWGDCSPHRYYRTGRETFASSGSSVKQAFVPEGHDVMSALFDGLHHGSPTRG